MNKDFSKIKSFLLNPITLLVIIFASAYFLLPPQSANKTVKNNAKTVPQKDINLTINSLSNYNYIDKNELLKMRKNYVNKSVFKDKKYVPNAEIFGQVQSKKPWWGIDNLTCYTKNSDTNSNIKGLSEESRYLNNPNMLLGLRLSERYPQELIGESFCADKEIKELMPVKMTYNPKIKMITAVYEANDNFSMVYTTGKNRRNKVRFLLHGINAKDAGYNYIFASGEQNVMFGNFSDKTAEMEPVEILQFLHTGNSCKIAGGCNNVSPYQPELEFSIQKLPAEIMFSLWKTKPLYKFMPADFSYKIIILNKNRTVG